SPTGGRTTGRSDRRGRPPSPGRRRPRATWRFDAPATCRRPRAARLCPCPCGANVRRSGRVRRDCSWRCPGGRIAVQPAVVEDARAQAAAAFERGFGAGGEGLVHPVAGRALGDAFETDVLQREEIGRASCRERGYV